MLTDKVLEFYSELREEVLEYAKANSLCDGDMAENIIVKMLNPMNKFLAI